MFHTDQGSTDGGPPVLPLDRGITVWQDSRRGAIWIAQGKANENIDRPQRFLCFEVAPDEHASSDASCQQAASSEVYSPLSVHIAVELFEKTIEAGNSSLTSPRVVFDSVAFELAIALLEIGALPDASLHTKFSVFSMLRSQLSSTKRASSKGLRRQRTGFEQWQRQRLKAALSQIEHSEVSLELFATKCGLSACHFARLFRATYGIPFYQYVIQRKIGRACELLLETRDPVSQIALECGFSDQSSFTRRFRAKVGKSPAAWREAPIFEPIWLLQDESCKVLGTAW